LAIKLKGDAREQATGSREEAGLEMARHEMQDELIGRRIGRLI